MGSRRRDEAPAWVRDAVFYQIFPDRFARSPSVRAPGDLEPWEAPPSVHGFKGGNLPGVTEHLDDLADLGVTAIYLNPVFASAANHRYHTYDYLHVDPLLGGDAALRELLDAAHARSMRVVLDGVFNHAGRGFWPFHHVLENGIASPYTDWFHVDHDALLAGRRLRAYPEHAADRPLDPEWAAAHREGRHSLAELGYLAWWDLPALPKLNVEHDEVRSFLLDVAEYWIRFGADGWRFDVPEEVAPGFWHEVRARVLAANPDAYLVGEVWHVAPEWVVPPGPFDGLMNYPLAWSLIGFAAGSHLDLAVAAEQSEMRRHLRRLDGAELLESLSSAVDAYARATRVAQLNLLGSHDTPRLRTLCGDDAAAVRLAMLLLLTLPGAPCIYYGDEVGMRGHTDPGCRAAMTWSGEGRDLETRDLVRAACRLRASTGALRDGELVPLAARAGACAYRRGAGVGAAWIVANAGDEPVTLELADLEADIATVLTVGAAPAIGSAMGGDIRVPGRSGAVLQRRGRMGR